MHKYNHYPIYSEDYELSKEQLLLYLRLFPEHRMQFTKRYEMIITKHLYEDGLHIEIRWQILDEYKLPNIASILSLSSLIKTAKKNIVRLETIEIIEYSKEKYTPSNEVVEKFNEITKLYKIDQKQYQLLEFEVLEESKLSDDFFKELMRRAYNVYKFHEYLEQRGLK